MEKKKATITDLLAMHQRNEEKNKREFEIEPGLFVEIVKPELNKVLNALELAEQGSTEEAFRANCMLIYDSVPLFRAKELRQEFDLPEPFMVVAEILGENIGKINKLAAQVLSMFGLEDDIKNE